MTDSIQGRGASWNPPNRFEPIHYEPDPESPPDEHSPGTIFLRDPARTLITRNDSPDVGFETSINPYRGCEHGCIYCYARPTHEYLGLSSGLDFESRILVKEDAPALLRQELSARSWTPQPIIVSGVTDAYQPIERRLRLTRGCLQVLADFRNPVAIITKSHLVTRDIDILGELASLHAAAVYVSITTLDRELARVMEPRASTPELRLDAVAQLSAAGIRAGVMVAPIIPAMTDHEIPSILAAAARAGATAAGYTVVRLPHALAPIFERWLEDHFPDRKGKVLHRIQSLRDGKLNDPRWGSRMHGEGIFADQIRALFEAGCRRAGIENEPEKLSAEHFRRPSGPQMTLFG